MITKVSRWITPGDEIITSKGKHYRLKKVGSNWAIAELLGIDRDYQAYTDQFSKIAVPTVSEITRNRTVAIYHTHTDESYLPSDGRISIPFNGGIIQVGSTYKSTLLQEGARVLHNVTPHDPHDNNAYYRSRRTAFQLMKNNPLAIFDVHRDGIDDPEFYREYIANKNVAQIRIVIGRQNPHMAANLDFAKKMMAYANRINPSIVKEIFMGSGNYNQDLMPTALLLEAGTYTNRKEEAMKGVELLAHAVPVVLGFDKKPAAPLSEPENRQSGAWWSLALIIFLTLLGGGAFVLVNAGSPEEAKKQVSLFYKANLSGTLSILQKKIKGTKWYKSLMEWKRKLP
ncbi:MAG: stage II sporulation protein P [Bacillota bacterium]